ncbi:hypothetical protein Dda_1354 [Drechslerella dactyloides]|uniref:Up-regulated during septation protein 1 domain-containing protein n=1 Tax=Drechslerella dactyloides TaxID=74499 RepID=A0AAD6J631_DREDA|nr:hypothetical protein Dda_1354 [Drechslerella dactyloides]
MLKPTGSQTESFARGGVLDPSLIRLPRSDMATPNPSNAAPNFDDNNIAWHLLVETAIFDSTSYDLLSHEELDQLKKERPVLVGRIDALKRKLLLETKVRDAARSLSRLQSPAHNETPQSLSNLSFPGGSSENPDPATQANAELNASVARCEEINADIYSLDSRLRDVQLRLLRHTAGVLAATHHNNKLRYRNSGDGAVPASSYHIFASKLVQPPLKPPAPEGFDHRSLYHPSNSFDEHQMAKSETGRRLPHASPASNPELYSTESIGDVTKTQDLSLSANGRLIGQSGTREVRNLASTEAKLVNLNTMVEGMLLDLEPTLVTLTTDNSVKTLDSSRKISGQRGIDSLENGLARLQTIVLGARNNIRATPVDTKPIEESLAPIWGIVLDYEAGIPENNMERDFQLMDSAVGDNGGGLDTGTKVEGRGIEHLEARIRLMTQRALQLTREQASLREQLSQVSLQKQLEMQKNEDAKTSHEQQILGLTNSLSNTLNELSQVSSHQDVNVLKQEVSKLKIELTEKDRLYNAQLGELQAEFDAQQAGLEERSNAAIGAARDQERALAEALRSKEEELDRATEALEHNLIEAKDSEKKYGIQQEMIDSLRDEINKSQADMSQNESQSLISKKRLEELSETLKTREIRIAELERSVKDLTNSYNAISAQHDGQSRTIEGFQATVEDLQDKLEERDIHLAEHRSVCEGLKFQLEESKASQTALEAEVMKLEAEIRRLAAEIESLAADLGAARAASREKDQATEGKPQAALDAGLIAELENLSNQNKELLEVNTMLQTKLMDTKASGEAEYPADYQSLKDKCESLQKELKGMLFDYEALMRSSVDFEAERVRLETQIDTLQDKLETVEGNLADERIRWLGGGNSAKTPTIQTNGVNTPAASSGDSMTMAVLRAEFKKMIRDMRTEHGKALRVSATELPVQTQPSSRQLTSS